jgi:hypothetical protein
LAAVLVTSFLLVLLVVPSVLLGDSLVSGAYKLVESFQSGDLSIPPPPDSVAHWPLIGEPIARAWTLASENYGCGVPRSGHVSADVCFVPIADIDCMRQNNVAVG